MSAPIGPGIYAHPVRLVDGLNNALIAGVTALGEVKVTGSATVTGSVSVTNFPAIQAVSQSGTWTVQQGSPPWSVSQSGTWNINNISGTISLPTGAATESTLSTLNGKIPSGLTVTSTRLLVDGSGVTQPISAASLPLPTGAATESTLSTFSNRFTSSTSSISRVSSSASSVSILASTAGRKGASFYNESTQSCYLKLGTTASLTSYTILMLPGGFFILNNDPVYTGAIDAIWSAANGALQITELS